LKPSLLGLFDQGQFQTFCATGGRWGDEVLSTTLAWARGYERNWNILEPVAFYLGGAASLADLLNGVSEHSHLTPAGVATGVGKDYESALVELAEKPMGDGPLQLTNAMFSPNWGSPRVTARELRAAIAHIKPGGEHAFLGFMVNCDRTLRPRHIALASYGPMGYTSHCVDYLTVCGEDMDLAIAYRAAGVNNIDILRQLVALNVPPEYAGAL